MRTPPDGWEYVSDYCIKRGGYTICRVSDLYELWKGREQLVVNLKTTEDALNEYAKRHAA